MIVLVALEPWREICLLWLDRCSLPWKDEPNFLLFSSSWTIFFPPWCMCSMVFMNWFLQKMAEIRNISSASSNYGVDLGEVNMVFIFSSSHASLFCKLSVSISNWQIRPQSAVSNEDFRKVFDRPFVAPRPFESGPQTSDVPTSHYDYNFDEKDYKCEFIDYFQLFSG